MLPFIRKTLLKRSKGKEGKSKENSETFQNELLKFHMGAWEVSWLEQINRRMRTWRLGMGSLYGFSIVLFKNTIVGADVKQQVDSSNGHCLSKWDVVLDPTQDHTSRTRDSCSKPSKKSLYLCHEFLPPPQKKRHLQTRVFTAVSTTTECFVRNISLHVEEMW